MARTDDLYTLPQGLPVPQDDGACAHLTGMKLPSIALRATNSAMVDLSRLPGRTIVYCYPRTGRPDQPLLPGWNDIPGARGCTPQTVCYRDHYQELRQLGVSALFGLSTQDTAYQQEVVDRLHLPFPLLSDEHLAFTHALKLPTFDIEGMTLTRRLTLIVNHGRIERVFYPVFPSDSDAPNIIRWLKDQTQ
ncbi:MAG: peroxiredoxin [Pseudomonadota bacterium]